MSVNFTPANILPVARRAGSVNVSDLNGDGFLDILVGGFNDPWGNSFAPVSGFSTLLGMGNGQFSPAVISSGHPFISATTIAIGDFNNDNHADVISTGNGSGFTANDVFLALGDGTGKFTPGTSSFVGNDPGSIAVADLNEDGNLDAITANQDGNTATILWGDGTGNFPSIDRVALGGKPQSIALQDFDGDGRLDLAAVVTTAGTQRYTTTTKFVLLQGNANRSFTPSASVNIISNGFSSFGYSDLAFADFNQDGSLDVAALSDSNISFLLGTTTAEQFELAFQTELSAQSISAGDFNGDGHVDLVTAAYGSSSNAISVLLGNGVGNFSRPTTFPAIGSYSTPSIATGDFDRDGKLDIVSASSNSSEVAVLLNITTETDAITQGAEGYNAIGYIDASSESSGSITVSLAEGTFVLNAPTPITRSVYGVDEVIGTAQNDQIKGNQNKNFLNGMGGNDKLTGGRSDDRLVGGAGKDELMGGKGKDRFVFSATSNYPEGREIHFQRSLLGVDRIVDFDTKNDKIILDIGTFTALSARKRVSFATVDNLAEARTSRGIITYVQDSGRLYYNANRAGAGFGSGGLFAIVENNAALSTRSFSAFV